MNMTAMVHKSGSVTFMIDYTGIDADRVTYSFVSMRHFLAHFGAILPLTAGFRFRVYAIV